MTQHVLICGFSGSDAQSLGEFLAERSDFLITVCDFNGVELESWKAPEAKLIFLLQDPLSVVASCNRRIVNPLGRPWSDREDALSFAHHYNRSLDFAASMKRSGDLLVVSYARLFVDGYGLERIFNFLDCASLAPSSFDLRPKRKNSPLTLKISKVIRDNINWRLFEDLAASIHQGSEHDVYSAMDKPLINYKSQPVPGFSIALRDPGPRNMVCLGSAATFGRFVSRPYPAIIDAANLGIGGARPESYLYEPISLSRLSLSNVAIIEVMSARGYSNPAFSSVNRFSNMVELRSINEVLHKENSLQGRFFVDRFWQLVFQKDFDWAMQLVEHCQRSWLSDMKDLLRFSRRPVLLWFSQHEPPNDISGLENYSFPHFITKGMIDKLDAEYVEVVSAVGIPYRLKNSKGEDVPILKGWPDPALNKYYPSQEMHEIAAAALKNKI